MSPRSTSVARSRTILVPSRTDFRSDRAPPSTTTSRPFPVRSSMRLRDRPSSLARRRSVRRLVGTGIASRISSLRKWFRTSRQQALLGMDVHELLDPLGPVPQICDVECVAAYPPGVVGLERVQIGWIDVPAVAPLQHRSVPCVVAGRALVDQPGVEDLAAGVQPELLAATKRPDCMASAAREPWSRWGLGCDRSIVLGVHRTCRLALPGGKFMRTAVSRCLAPRRGVAGSLGFEIRRADDQVRQRLSHCQTGLEPPPDERNRSRQCARIAMRKLVKLTRPAATWAK